MDITSDNQAAFDEGVASVDNTSDNQAAFDEGVASVDITVDTRALTIRNQEGLMRGWNGT